MTVNGTCQGPALVFCTVNVADVPLTASPETVAFCGCPNEMLLIGVALTAPTRQVDEPTWERGI